MIDMTNHIIGTIRVIHPWRSIARHAAWWCVCLLCGEGFAERGDNLRKAARVPGWVLHRCRT